MIQENHQNQMRLIEQTINRLGLISGYLYAVKAVFEVSFDEDIEIEKETKEKGYRCEMEYYAAHRDKKWISTSALLNTLLVEIKKAAESLKNDLINMPLETPSLQKLRSDLLNYSEAIISIKEFSFKLISTFDKQGAAINRDFQNCKNMSTQELAKKVLADKVMIILYILIAILIIATVTTYCIGI